MRKLAQESNRFAYSLKKAAFTVCEIIIVMGILGIVAELTVPGMVKNVTETAWLRTMDKFEATLTEATKQMNVNQELTGYATNQDFVNAFKKYIKVDRTCTVANMSNCFSSSLKTVDDEVIELNTLTNGASIGQKTNTSELIGIRFANGITGLLAYKPDCEGLNWYDSSGGIYDTAKQGRQYTAGGTTSCLALVYDANGPKKPNKIGKDIALLNAKITTCDGTKVAGMCVSDGITYSPVSGNYWQGATNQCAALGMTLPSVDQMQSIRTAGHITSGHYWTSTPATGQWAEYQAIQIVMNNGSTYTASRSEPGFNAVCVN